PARGGALSLGLVQSWFGPPTAFAMNTVSWSLSCELFFYALFPLVFAGALRVPVRRRRAVMAGLVAMTVVTVLLAQALAGRSAGNWVTYFPPSRLAEFALGILLALEVRDGRWPSVGVPRAALMALGAALAAGVWADIRYSVVITVVPYVLLIGAAADHDRAGQTSALHRGWLVRLGLWSYALYLVHGVVLSASRPHGP